MRASIARSERQKVFDPIYKIAGSRDPDTGGVGFGLAVTRSIIWKHGGDISLATRNGGGLSVRLELPAGPGQSSLVPVKDQVEWPGPGA
jgi:K+-sensing histidine kinase KdpD